MKPYLQTESRKLIMKIKYTQIYMHRYCVHICTSTYIYLFVNMYKRYLVIYMSPKNFVLIPKI